MLTAAIISIIPKKEYWKKNSAFIVEQKGDDVKWQTVYDLLDEQGNAVLTETQNWSIKLDSGKYVLSLEWKGKQKTDVTIGKHEYGGLFCECHGKKE